MLNVNSDAKISSDAKINSDNNKYSDSNGIQMLNILFYWMKKGKIQNF